MKLFISSYSSHHSRCPWLTLSLPVITLLPYYTHILIIFSMWKWKWWQVPIWMQTLIYDSTINQQQHKKKMRKNRHEGERGSTSSREWRWNYFSFIWNHKSPIFGCECRLNSFVSLCLLSKINTQVKIKGRNTRQRNRADKNRTCEIANRCSYLCVLYLNLNAKTSKWIIYWLSRTLYRIWINNKKTNDLCVHRHSAQCEMWAHITRPKRWTR